MARKSEQLDQRPGIARERALWHGRGMAKKRVVVLDPEMAFDRAARHWRRCKRCRNTGAERARLESLCPRGRKLTRIWDETERIYETAEAA